MPSNYYKKWRKEHPRLQIYLSREEYDWLKELAEKEGVSMKELILNAIEDLKECYMGFDKALDLFIENPDQFYVKLMERIQKRNWKTGEDFSWFDPVLFTYPCYYCGKPVPITYNHELWGDIKKDLYEIIRDKYRQKIYHHKCRIKSITR